MNIYKSYLGRSQPDIWSCKCNFFCVYRPYKDSISEELNNDSHLNLHSMTKFSAGFATESYARISHDVISNAERKIKHLFLQS